MLDISYRDYCLREISPETSKELGKSKHMCILDQRMERWRQGPDLNMRKPICQACAIP